MRAALAVLLLAGCASLDARPSACITDAECQGSRATLYDVEALTEAQVDSIIAERRGS